MTDDERAIRERMAHGYHMTTVQQKLEDINTLLAVIDALRTTEAPVSTVWLVVHEFKGGNEAGSVLSIWTEKEKAERERRRLRAMETIASAYDYEVNDAPINVSGTSTLN